MSDTYRVGEIVEVHAFGRWYGGEIVKLGKISATVRYTSGTGCTRDKAVGEAKIRKHPLGPGVGCVGEARSLRGRTEEEKAGFRRQGDLRRFANDCRYTRQRIDRHLSGETRSEWAEDAEAYIKADVARLAKSARDLGLVERE